eukprot:scaffold83971_cov19-Tisochrysis_lutea.AAC.1
MALWRDIQAKQKGGFKADQDEEYEDAQGNVYNKRTYLDLKKQGLIRVHCAVQTEQSPSDRVQRFFLASVYCGRTRFLHTGCAAAHANPSLQCGPEHEDKSGGILLCPPLASNLLCHEHTYLLDDKYEECVLQSKISMKCESRMGWSSCSYSKEQ